MNRDQLRAIARAFRAAREGSITPEESAVRATAHNPTLPPTVPPTIGGWLGAQYRAARRGRLGKADMESLEKNHGSSDV